MSDSASGFDEMSDSTRCRIRRDDGIDEMSAGWYLW